MKITKILISVLILCLTLAGGIVGYCIYDKNNNGFQEISVSVCVEQSADLTLEKPIRNLKWSSENEGVVTVDDAGHVLGVTAGETEVIAKKGIKRYQCKVTVTEHQLTERSCTEPETCALCGIVKAEALGHDFNEATCTEDSICVGCGLVKEKALGHDWSEATCEKAEYCRRCGLEQGEPLGHISEEATCTEAAFCSRCNQELAPALGHSCQEATCTGASICSRCNQELAPALGHDWSEATCEQPATCKRCKKTTGKTLAHTYLLADTWAEDTVTYKKYICALCGNEKMETEKKEVQDSSQFADKVLQLVNEERANCGLQALSMNYTLATAANVRANEIVQTFSHTRPDGTQCFTAFNVEYRTAGENIAAGYRTPEAVVKAWMNSEGHRANILSAEFTQLAVGYVYGSGTSYGHYWVQLFIG